MKKVKGKNVEELRFTQKEIDEFIEDEVAVFLSPSEHTQDADVTE